MMAFTYGFWTRISFFWSKLPLSALSLAKLKVSPAFQRNSSLYPASKLTVCVGRQARPSEPARLPTPTNFERRALALFELGSVTGPKQPGPGASIQNERVA